MCIANIFSQSLFCLFSLFTVSFIEKFLILTQSNLLGFFFSFIDHAFNVVSKKSSPNSGSSRFSLVLFSRSFRALHFTFRSMIQFVLIFVKCVRSNHLLKDNPLFIKLPLLLCLFLTLCSVSLTYLSILLSIPHCRDSCSFTLNLEIEQCQLTNFALFFQYYVGYSESFPLHKNFGISLLIFIT